MQREELLHKIRTNSKLKLKKVTLTSIFVISVINPSSIFLQTIDAIAKIMEALDQYLSEAYKLVSNRKYFYGEIDHGCPCAVEDRDSEDGKLKWYRSRVVEDWTGRYGIVRVKLIDYGRFKYLHSSKVLKLSEEFSEARPLANECTLHDIRPLDDLSWKKQTTERLKELIGEKSVFGRLVGYCRGRPGIKLYVVCADEVNLISEGSNISCSMNILEECLTWGKRVVDPWNRVSCCRRSVLLLVEFCQTEGPRPFHCYPSDSLPHLDLDNVAMWLMSSESIEGSTIVIYNQQTAIYACIYYSILLDIRARGFQRPLCFAYLSTSKPTSDLLNTFVSLCQAIFRPVMACNRQLFMHHASTLFNFCDTITCDEISSFSANTSKSPISRIEALALQARKFMQRMKSANVSTENTNKIVVCSAHSRETLEEWLNAFGTPYSVPLLDINHVAPCVFGSFINAINNSYSMLINVSTTTRSGSLYCADRCVLKLTDYCIAQPAVKNSEWLTNDDSENTLRSISDKLDQVLYPILNGGRFAVCASSQRKPAAIDLLHKLSAISVKTSSEDVFWLNETDEIPAFATIFGKTLSREESSKWSAHDVDTIFDLNGSRLRSREYTGVVLSPLSNKKLFLFPSDRSLVSYVAALLTEFCAIVFMAKFKGSERISNLLKLTNDDTAMLANFLIQLDYVKYNKLKDSVRDTCKSNQRSLQF